MTLTDLALEALTEAYSCARGEQLHLLRRGYKPKAFGEAGLNEFSYLYGRFRAFWLMAELPVEEAPTAVDVRRAGAEDAYAQFVDEIYENPDQYGIQRRPL